MLVHRLIYALLLMMWCFACVVGCDGSDAASGGGGISGVYSSVENDELKFEFSAGGTVVASMAGEKGQPGTYSVDGEKVIVDFSGQKTIFIRDGDCMTDLQNMYGKMCKGGAAGAAANVSTRTPPPTSGTWVAANEDGAFTIEFVSAGKLAMTMTPSAAIPNARPDTQDGTFTIEGDALYVTLANSTPVVLKWVNGAYESTAFGLPMKFTKK